MQHVQCGMPETDRITLMEYILRLYGIDMSVIFDSEYRHPGINGPDPRHIQIIGLCLYAVCVLYKGVAKDVVKMQMGIEQKLYLQIVILYECCQLISFTGKIQPGSMIAASLVSSHMT